MYSISNRLTKGRTRKEHCKHGIPKEHWENTSKIQVKW